MPGPRRQDKESIALGARGDFACRLYGEELRARHLTPLFTRDVPGEDRRRCLGEAAPIA